MRLSVLIHKKGAPFVLIAILVSVIFFISGLVFNNREINTIKPRVGPIVEAVYGIGSVTPKREYNLKIGIMSTLEQIFASEGDTVKKGTPLVKIFGIPSFRAPFAGTITAINLEEGETVFPQLPILTLVDTRDLYLQVILEQDAALRVRAGQTARFSFETLQGKKFSGKIKSIYPSGGQFKVHIDVDNFPPEVLPGMTADTAIEVAKRENVLQLPVSAVNNGKSVIIRGGKKIKTEVETGTNNGEWVEIISGDIQESDDIIVQKVPSYPESE